MKLNQAIKTLVAATALVAAGAVMSAPVVSLVGDKDGLGLGLVSGEGFAFSDVGPTDRDRTDEWVFGGVNVLHQSTWTGTLFSASLQIFSGGWGLDSPAQVYLNNTLIGLLTNGDDSGPSGNAAFLDVFDLTPYLNLLTGSDTVEIRTSNPDDGGALDYSQLSLQILDASGGGNNVPEPATVALVGLALAGVSLQSRRRRVTRPQYIQTRTPSRFE